MGEYNPRFPNEYESYCCSDCGGDIVGYGYASYYCFKCGPVVSKVKKSKWKREHCTRDYLNQLCDPNNPCKAHRCTEKECRCPDRHNQEDATNDSTRDARRN